MSKDEQDELEREDASPEIAETAEPELDADAEAEMKQLLRGAFKEPEPESDVLRGVQKRLRERSGGKFYADEWSTSKRTPIGIYLVTSALMLAVVLVAYAVMGFLKDEPRPVDNTPAPVQIVFPKPK